MKRFIILICILLSVSLAWARPSPHQRAEELARKWVYNLGDSTDTNMRDDTATQAAMRRAGFRLVKPNHMSFSSILEDTELSRDSVVDRHAWAGMGAMLVYDETTGIHYVVFKGTQDPGDWLAHKNNLMAGVGIGFKQFQRHRKDLLQWAHYLRNETVIVCGHSLGGALAQRFAADFVDDVGRMEVVTFQSPGVDQATRSLLKSSLAAKGKKGLPVTHYSTDHDVVQSAGAMVSDRANIVLGSGGSSNPKTSHSEWLLDPALRPEGMKLRRIRSRDYGASKSGRLTGYEDIGNSIIVQVVDAKSGQPLDGVSVMATSVDDRSGGNGVTGNYKGKGTAKVSLISYLQDHEPIRIILKKPGYKTRSVRRDWLHIVQGWGWRGKLKLTPAPEKKVASGTGMKGRIYLGRKNATYFNQLSLVVGPKSFKATIGKNSQPFYGIKCWGQASGEVKPFIDSMTRQEVSGRKKLVGTVTGTCESSGESYPIKGTFSGVLFDDGTARGYVEYYAPPFRYTGREYGHYEWEASR